jgi:ABC-type branched-subunit amino acid transport system substrate-binding protein
VSCCLTEEERWKKVVLVVFVFLASVALAQPIKLGVNLELSGRFAQIGNAALEGIRTALEQAPEVAGRPVELSICDNQLLWSNLLPAPTVSWTRVC